MGHRIEGITSIWQGNEHSNLDDLLLRYQQSLARLKELGVRVPASSRLLEYEKRFSALLAQTANSLLVPVNEEAEMLFCFREMDEINLIVNSFHEEPTAQEMNRLRLLSSGSQNPHKEGMARTRDAQFELCLRAEFAKAGATIEMGEPDLRVSFAGQAFPLEAKRPASHRRFEDRLREAVGQLDRLQEDGVAALSLDRVIVGSGGYWSLEKASELNAASFYLLKDYVDSNFGTLLKRVRGRKLAAVMLVLRQPFRARDTKTALLGTAFLSYGPRAKDKVEEALALLLQACLPKS